MQRFVCIEPCSVVPDIDSIDLIIDHASDTAAIETPAPIATGGFVIPISVTG